MNEDEGISMSPQVIPNHILMGGPMPNYPANELSSEVVKMILDDAFVVEQVEHGLRNERQVIYEDEQKRLVYRWEPIPNSKPLMNEEGISDTIQVIYSYCNTTNSTTDIPAEKVDELVKNGIIALIGLYELNWKRYGIDKTKLTHIVQNILKPRLYAGLRKGANGNTLKTLRTNWQLSELRQNVQSTTDVSAPRVKKSIFGL